MNDRFDSVSLFETRTFLYLSRVLVPIAIVSSCLFFWMWRLTILPGLFINDADHDIITLTFNYFNLESEKPTPSHLNINQQLTPAFTTYLLNSVLNDAELRGMWGVHDRKGEVVEQVLEFLFEDWKFLAQLLIILFKGSNFCSEFLIILFKESNLCPLFLYLFHHLIF